MIAALPMYDWPGLRAATDAFWVELARRLRSRGIDAPAGLNREGDPAALWADPALLLGQTCGMPFVSGLCGAARIVGRPDYALPEAAGGSYRSVIVVRAGAAARPLAEWRDGRVAVNEWRSYSGHVALRAHLAGRWSGVDKPFFAVAELSGSHRESAAMVARGAADLAALDGVVWALLQAEAPEIAAALAVIARTDPAPALPFITAARHEGLIPALVEALAGAAAALSPVPGLPRAVLPAAAADYAPIRAAARRAAAEPFAPQAPALPPV